MGRWRWARMSRWSFYNFYHFLGNHFKILLNNSLLFIRSWSLLIGQVWLTSFCDYSTRRLVFDGITILTDLYRVLVKFLFPAIHWRFLGSFLKKGVLSFPSNIWILSCDLFLHEKVISFRYIFLFLRLLVCYRPRFRWLFYVTHLTYLFFQTEHVGSFRKFRIFHDLLNWALHFPNLLLHSINVVNRS